MSIKMADKASIIQEYQVHERDCGSTEVQVAVLTKRIRGLTEHLKTNKKDKHTQRGLVTLVSRRNRLLTYLRKKDDAGYKALIEKLGIRGIRTNV
ncbi:MAG: small subunit ribosomal protein S15 [Pseudohongiellaceae bacterium]|jgi:small subunit ribosomal protein S15